MADKTPIPKDPIQTHSMALPIFLATGLLVASFVVAMLDEFFWRRPYKTYQRDFSVHYYNYLDGILPTQDKKLEDLQQKDKYKEIDALRAAADAQSSEPVAKIAATIEEVLSPNIKIVTANFKIARAKLNAKTYRYEIALNAGDDQKADNLMSDIEEIEEGPYEIVGLVEIDRLNEVVSGALPAGLAVTGGESAPALKTTGLSYNQMSQVFGLLKDTKAHFSKEQGRQLSAVKTYEAQLRAYVSKHLVGPHPDAIRRLLTKADDGKLGPSAVPKDDIIQIHIKDIDWVDRCESCHAGAREPIEMTARQLADSSKYFDDASEAVVFAAHSKDLLKIHNPEEFGCSTCHNGNGKSLTSVKLAHGLNKHWLYPLHAKENFDAGCVQCHTGDIQLKGAEVFNKGRHLYEWKGCVGCHKYAGYDGAPEELRLVKQEQVSLVSQREHMKIRQDLIEDGGEKQVLDMEMSNLDTRLAELAKTETSVSQEIQKVGPSLRNLKKRVVRGWLEPWVKNPRSFKPHTKMPVFRLTDDNARAVSAFLWQNADDPSDVAVQPKGNADNGRTLFMERGCLGCHTIDDGGAIIGDGFATELSRAGDKMNYDFLVKWIKEPDSGVMPNLRLSWEDSRDIASYLMTKKQGTAWPSGDEIENAELFDAGQVLVRHNGCAGCHEIKGMEAEGRIGTELTHEGAKPKERLDFGRGEHDYKKGHGGPEENDDGTWSHKSFFEDKLRYPDFFGQGKLYLNPNDKLRMPDFGLDDSELNALTTFLLGSVDTELGKTKAYKPTGRAKAIQEGWWIVQKYNCTGCHQLDASTQPKLWDMAQYTGEDDAGEDRSVWRPPTLVGQGFRTDPIWLSRFLRNPSLTDPVADGNGVRRYLKIRMPTFRMSDREVSKLVRFFDAMASQPEPFVPPILEPLTGGRLIQARNIFKGLGCVSCHETGEPEQDAQATGPLLTHVGSRLKAGWVRRWLQEPKVLSPGTSMPSNFRLEQKFMVKGREVIGYDVLINSLKGTLSCSQGGKMVSFPLADCDLNSMTPIRWIAEGNQDIEGDHVDLITRYLKLAYDEREVPLSKPN